LEKGVSTGLRERGGLASKIGLGESGRLQNGRGRARVHVTGGSINVGGGGYRKDGLAETLWPNSECAGEKIGRGQRNRSKNYRGKV